MKLITIQLITGILPSFLGLTLLLGSLLLQDAASAQPPQGGPGGMGPGGPREPIKILEEYDKNADGWLNQAERIPARQAAKSNLQRRRGGGPPGGFRRRGNGQTPKPGPSVSPKDVNNYPTESLYDRTVLRTFFLEFENADWEKELEDFHGTDIEVPAQLTVDGKTYQNVGIRFRGASSYGMVQTGFKRSFNVSIDMVDKDQRLYGYKTINLLNSNGDASFMSTVLYSEIANQYIPAPKANHVQVVINGKSWGIYVNVQQFNKDFLGEHFDSTKGTRWKVSGSPRGDGGLRYLGDELEPYQERFEMKSNDGKKAWKKLVRLCKVLNETPPEDLVKELEPVLDIESTLKFLALDVVLVNSDGYWTRASDYSLFADSDGKFHVFPHDMNESFGTGRGGPGGPGGPGRQGPPPRGGPQDRPPGGGFGFGPIPGFGPPPSEFGPGADRRRPAVDRRSGQEGSGRDQGQNRRPRNRSQPDFQERGGGESRGRGRIGPDDRGGPGGHGGGGPTLDPLVGLDNERMPLRSRLLAVPKLKARYLEYVQKIAEDSLDWRKIGPIVERQADLIRTAVSKDTRKLDTLEAFDQATSNQEMKVADPNRSLKAFFQQRREFLLKLKTLR
ncbi:MAG: CotH kinase family protein [Planctomycetota bacterium]